GVASRWTRVLGASASLTFSGSSQPPTNSVRLPRGHGRTTRARASIRSFAAHCAISGYAMATYSELREHVLNALWSQWHELGVAATVPRRHSDDVIDPEPLIAFTATHGDLDPRLRDESIDWVLRYATYVSKARLKNVLRDWGLIDDPLYREYAATLNAVVGPLRKRATRWTATFGVLHLILDVTRSGTKRSDLQNALEAVRLLNERRALFAAAGIEIPSLPPDTSAWPAFLMWSVGQAKSIAGS